MQVPLPINPSVTHIDSAAMLTSAVIGPSPASRATSSGLRTLADHVEAAVAAPMSELAGRLEMALSAAIADPTLVPAHARLARAEGYNRHLLHADPLGRFSIVSLVWGKGQFSPVHGHHAWCSFAVLDGQLTETTYTYDTQTALAMPQDTRPLTRGATRFEYAGISTAHKLGNAEDNAALSLHIYGIDGARVGTHVNHLVQGAPH